MGTRNLTIAVKNGEVKIAQYGQWDGYPSGQGLTALKFLRVKSRRNKLAKQLDKCEFLTQEQLDQAYKAIGVETDFMTQDQGKKFSAKFPLLTRDHGAEILKLVAESSEPKLVNSYDFASDSLFCEWAYVVDFDKNTFEVYKGFNQNPVPTGERFASMKKTEKDYYPIRHSRTFELDKLPTAKDFMRIMADHAD